MRFLKRFCCIALSVIIISLSIGTRYFDSNHMENVEAVAEGVAVGLSAAAMYAICFYIGTVAYANAPIEMNNLSDDQIVSMGHSTITYMVNNGLLDSLSTPSASVPSPPMIGFIDKAGQTVAFSEEAARRIAATSLLLIQMSANSPDNGDDDDGNDDDNNDDDESNIRVSNGLIEVAKNPKDLFACCGVGFATILGSVIREQYDKYQNGEESIYQIEMEKQFFTDYEKIRNPDGTYNIIGFARTALSSINDYNTWSVISSVSDKVCLVHDVASAFPYRYRIYSLSQYNSLVNLEFQKSYFSPSGNRSWNDTTSSIHSNLSISVSFNIPVFGSLESYTNAFNSGDYSEALNYSEGYRIADWIQDDWKGK